MSLPQHGMLNCARCFNGCDTKLIQPHPLWLLKNDPGAWGGSQPNVLVLGFSKGSTQTDIYKTGNFEDVAFGGGARNRLDEVLKKLHLLEPYEHVSNEITNPNSRFSFGSMIRCSLTREDKDGKHSSSGDLVVKSFKEVPHIFDNCTEQFLSNLPQHLSLIIMLGVNDKYISGCFEVFKKQYPELKRLNNVSYGFGDKTFVHVAHPSPANGHFNDWCKGSSKFLDALSAIKQRVANELLLTPLTEENLKPLQETLAESGHQEATNITSNPQSNVAEHAKPINESREAKMSSELFFHKFYLLHKDGHKLYPVRVKNLETGKHTFRVSEGGKGGNTKDASLEISNANQLSDYVLNKGFAIRASTLDKSVKGLYKVGQRSIIRAVI
ncbi:hypothetical protein Q4557_19300 [Shewanella sp. 5_MG-2023]|uniref:hypothetical protein n=1 Tax=Shewanella sp. 5_MG-2023 TaxID=3062656 RepID=UPI0026E3A3F6|nr:hypothetical protein [Shewanella sp. 5_MG-2023]MDO6642102.1 hypothetical protein [Shewanella sp. 5_MG-2023]